MGVRDDRRLEGRTRYKLTRVTHVVVKIGLSAFLVAAHFPLYPVGVFLSSYIIGDLLVIQVTLLS